MTSASVALTEPVVSAPSKARRRDLIEFMLVGGATLVLFPISWLLRTAFGLEWSEFVVSFTAFYAASLINDPHFAVTYLLFYKDVKNRILGSALSPMQRARYVFAGIVAPIALASWGIGAIATQSARGMGLLIQLMFLLVGWHYVKQGFGVLTVLSARRGAFYDALERRVILTHCYAGWAYAWASPFDPGSRFEEKGVLYTSIAHPRGLELLTGIVFAASSIALIAVLVRKWRRDRKWPPLAPLIGFLVTVWLWTVFSGIDPLMVYVIPGLHSAQYLYFVWLLKRNEAREAEGPPFFGRPTGLRLAMLAGSALALGWLLFRAPTFVDTPLPPGFPAELGPTPYFAALFAFVNIHHYFMDFVIWRRENPETRYLRA